MKKFQHYLIERKNNSFAFYSHFTREMRAVLHDLHRRNGCPTTVLLIQATKPSPEGLTPADVSWDSEAGLWAKNHATFLENNGAMAKLLPIDTGLVAIQAIAQQAMDVGSVVIVVNRGNGKDLLDALQKQLDIAQTVDSTHYFRRFIV